MLELPDPIQPKDPVTHEMSIFEHLAELRYRLIVAVIALFVGGVIAYSFSSQIFKLLNEPYLKAFPNNPLIGTGPAEAFLMRLKVSLFSGAVIVSPFLFAQIWLFVTPGLYEHEKRLLIPFVASTTILFLIGVAFCHKIILPLSYSFFEGEFREIGVTPAIKIDENLSLVITTLLGFGAVFEMPIIAYFLGRVGFITHRSMIDSGRYAIVLIFIVATLLAPPDVMSQCLLAGPLVLLYGLSILLVKYTGKKPTT